MPAFSIHWSRCRQAGAAGLSIQQARFRDPIAGERNSTNTMQTTIRLKFVVWNASANARGSVRLPSNRL